MKETKTAREHIAELLTDLIADVIAPTLPAIEATTHQPTQETRKRDAIRLASRVAYL